MAHVKLVIGQRSETVTVEPAFNRVNTEQETAQVVITRQKIEK